MTHQGKDATCGFGKVCYTVASPSHPVIHTNPTSALPPLYPGSFALHCPRSTLVPLLCTAPALPWFLSSALPPLYPGPFALHCLHSTLVPLLCTTLALPWFLCSVLPPLYPGPFALHYPRFTLVPLLCTTPALHRTPACDTQKTLKI